MDAHALICGVLANTDAVRRTRMVADQHRQQAINELLALPASAARNALRMMANQIALHEK